MRKMHYNYTVRYFSAVKKHAVMKNASKETELETIASTTVLYVAALRAFGQQVAPAQSEIRGQVVRIKSCSRQPPVELKSCKQTGVEQDHCNI